MDAERQVSESSRSHASAGSPYFADLVGAVRATPRAEVDALLGLLSERKQAWVRLGIEERLELLETVRNDFLAVSERWVAAELEAKGVSRGSLAEAEEWTLVATVLRAIRTLRGSLEEIRDAGRPRIPGAIQARPDGQVVVRAFPSSVFDRLVFPGVTGDVWMEPGITRDATLAHQASAYADAQREGRVAFVLGAGNASMLPVIDFLHKLFVELQVVVLKLNPVNAHLGPLMEEGFRALIEPGFLRVLQGGADEGRYLSNHPSVDELHLTGSDKTYEAIVFGAGEEGQRRKRERDLILKKRFTGELGNVSPVIVVPGPWRRRDVDEQAKNIATWLVANAGFACLTPRVLIHHASWPQRVELMRRLGRILDGFPNRRAYYPGARERHAEYIAAHPNALCFGTPERDQLPWTIVPGVDPAHREDICFRREAFCGLLAETALEAESASQFLDRAVDFANETLWGSLSATLIVHPRSMRDPEVAAAVDRAIARLRYGTVSLNILAFYSAYFMTTPWGAFPGHEAHDIQSGIGKTFNFLMFDRPQKSVITAPFRRLDPVTIRARRAPAFCRRLVAFEASPSWSKLPALGLAALRS
jgi:acyl-CoA reductase-like NAD-dependent aldehyde dehydrogenase